MHFAELAASKVLGMGDICDIEERSGRFFGLRRVGPPVLPTPNELLTKGFPFGFSWNQWAEGQRIEALEMRTHKLMLEHIPFFREGFASIVEKVRWVVFP